MANREETYNIGTVSPGQLTLILPFSLKGLDEGVYQANAELTGYAVIDDGGNDKWEYFKTSSVSTVEIYRQPVFSLSATPERLRLCAKPKATAVQIECGPPLNLNEFVGDLDGCVYIPLNYSIQEEQIQTQCVIISKDLASRPIQQTSTVIIDLRDKIPGIVNTSQISAGECRLRLGLKGEADNLEISSSEPHLLFRERAVLDHLDGTTTLEIPCWTDLAPGTHPVALRIKWNGGEREQIIPLTVEGLNQPEIYIDSIEQKPEGLSVNILVANRGDIIRGGTLRIKGEGFEPLVKGGRYIGELEEDDFSTESFVIKPTAETVKLHVVFNYIDKAWQRHTISKDFELHSRNGGIPVLPILGGALCLIIGYFLGRWIKLF